MATESKPDTAVTGPKLERTPHDKGNVGRRRASCNEGASTASGAPRWFHLEDAGPRLRQCEGEGRDVEGAGRDGVSRSATGGQAAAQQAKHLRRPSLYCKTGAELHSWLAVPRPHLVNGADLEGGGRQGRRKNRQAGAAGSRGQRHRSQARCM